MSTRSVLKFISKPVPHVKCFVGTVKPLLLVSGLQGNVMKQKYRTRNTYLHRLKMNLAAKYSAFRFLFADA